MFVYHGTKNAKDLEFNIKVKNGYQAGKNKNNFENGSGLYSVISHTKAEDFGDVVMLDLELDKKYDAGNVFIKTDDVKYFMATLSKKQLKDFTEIYNEKLAEGKDPGYKKEGIRASNVIKDLLILNDGRFHKIAQKVNDFLVEQNVKFSVSLFSGYEMVMIYDLNIIKNIMKPEKPIAEVLPFTYKNNTSATKKCKI